MELDKKKYYEYVESNIRPIIKSHESPSQTKKKIFSFLGNSKADRKEQIKKEVFGGLLKFFGNFEFNRDQVLPFQYLHNSMIIPEFTGYICEDRITGVFNSTKVDIAEVIFVKRSDSLAVFKGLIIILDVCGMPERGKPGLFLRGPFNGNTVIVADHKKHIDYIKNKFKDYTQIEPPVKGLEDRLEMYTTNVNEANRLICENFLNSFIGLSDYINKLEHQITHDDDKIKILKKAEEALDLSTKESNGARDSLWWEKVTEEVTQVNDAKLYETYKEDPLYGVSEIESLNNDIACSFYNDKVLLTIPHPHDLFEPNPINETPIIEEDIELVYNLMSAVCEITNTIIENKSS